MSEEEKFDSATAKQVWLINKLILEGVTGKTTSSIRFPLSKKSASNIIQQLKSLGTVKQMEAAKIDRENDFLDEQKKKFDRLVSAYDRGSADRYYGRPLEPHIWLDSLGKEVITKEEMTSHEIRVYEDGFRQELDRKDWGEE